MEIDLGYRWGTVDVPNGHVVWELPAACSASSHFSHPLCNPGWEENLPPGAKILAGPILDSQSGWLVLVAEPAAPFWPPAPWGRYVAHVARGGHWGFLDVDEYPLFAPATDWLCWKCRICGKPVYYTYGEGMVDFFEDPNGVYCLEHFPNLVHPREE